MQEATPIRIHVDGGGLEPVVHIAGEIDVATAPLVRAQLTELLDGGARRIVLDLRAVHFVDSSGLGVLVGALRRLQEERDGRMRVEGAQDAVRRVFEITGLGPTFGIPPG